MTPNELVAKHHRLPRATLRRMHVPYFVQEECETAAVIALVTSAHRFDKSRGVQFQSFAITRIRGAVLDAIQVYRNHETHDHVDACGHLTSRPGPTPDAAIDVATILGKLNPVDSSILRARFLADNFVVRGHASRQLRGALRRAREAAC